MTVLIALLARLGLPEHFRKLAAWAVLAAAALAGLALLKGCYDRSVIDRHQARLAVQSAAARDAAATERAADAASDLANERNLHDAVDTSPGGALSPAAHALACERLHKISRFPATCRPAGDNRGQADSGR
jgi:hypothetical protein